MTLRVHSRLGEALRELLRFARDPLRSRVIVVAVAERPTMVRSKRLYVTMAAGSPAFGFMRCPCGCGETIHLRFFGERRPRWAVDVHRSAATVEPSIWRTTGCRSHFVLKGGAVHWCEDERI